MFEFDQETETRPVHRIPVPYRGANPFSRVVWGIGMMLILVVLAVVILLLKRSLNALQDQAIGSVGVCIIVGITSICHAIDRITS